MKFVDIKSHENIENIVNSDMTIIRKDNAVAQINISNIVNIYSEPYNILIRRTQSLLDSKQDNLPYTSIESAGMFLRVSADGNWELSLPR